MIPSDTTHFWLSFVDVDGKNVGCCIVEAEGVDDEQIAVMRALYRARRLGCNPGGEVATVAFNMALAGPSIRSAPVGVLLTPEQARLL